MRSKRPEHDCPVCLDAHDEMIHAATVSLHAWWRQSLLNRLVQPEFEPELELELELETSGAD